MWPDNVRPISGWSEIVVTVAPTSDPDDPDKVPCTISLGDDTVYGGVLDTTSGVLTVTHGLSQIYATWNWSKSNSYPGGFYVDARNVLCYKPSTPFICSHAKSVSTIGEYVNGTCYCDNSLNFRLMSAADTIQDWKDYITAQANANAPITICYELDDAHKQTIQLSETEIKTLFGQNNIYADCGDITVTYKVWPAEESDQNDPLGLSIQPLDLPDTLQPSVLDPDVIDMLDLQPLDTEPEAEIDTDI